VGLRYSGRMIHKLHFLGSASTLHTVENVLMCWGVVYVAYSLNRIQNALCLHEYHNKSSKMFAYCAEASSSRYF
jgi:hypothetical protein